MECKGYLNEWKTETKTKMSNITLISAVGAKKQSKITYCAHMLILNLNAAVITPNTPIALL